MQYRNPARSTSPKRLIWLYSAMTRLLERVFGPGLRTEDLAELAERVCEPRIIALANDLDADIDELPLMDSSAVVIRRMIQLARDRRITDAEALETIGYALDVIRTGRV